MDGQKIVEDVLYKDCEVWKNGRDSSEFGTVIKVDGATLILYNRNTQAIYLVPTAYAEMLTSDELAEYYSQPDFDDPDGAEIDRRAAQVRDLWDADTIEDRRETALLRATELGTMLRKAVLGEETA